ncbi:MAG: outer membrane protein transport protein, partial [Pseudomonadales bacterium]|nr:outer membrane protein transport protein [Pseudomonadales bacterium]
SVDYQISLRDVTYWGTGVEYQYSENLVLRAGFEDRPSAVPDDAPNALIPLNDATLLSVGFGLDLEGDRHIDFAIGHMKSETDFPACSAQLGNGCDPSNVVYPSYAGQDIKTKVEVLLFELGFQQHF